MLFRVVAVDMRGYGETDKPSAVREYTVQKLTDDIRHLIPALGAYSRFQNGENLSGYLAFAVISNRLVHL